MIVSESWGFPGGRLRIENKKAGLTRHFELARGLEPLTCCLQDSCATDCATPAMPAKPTQFGTRRSQDCRRMPFRDRTSRPPRQQSAKPPRRVQDQVVSQRRLP